MSQRGGKYSSPSSSESYEVLHISSASNELFPRFIFCRGGLERALNALRHERATAALLVHEKGVTSRIPPSCLASPGLLFPFFPHCLQSPPATYSVPGCS